MILQQVLTESDLQNICVRPNSAVVVMAQSTMSVEQRREGGGGEWVRVPPDARHQNNVVTAYNLSTSHLRLDSIECLFRETLFIFYITSSV